MTEQLTGHLTGKVEPVSLQIGPLLQAVVVNNASDLHIKVGSPPKIRISGSLVPLQVAGQFRRLRPGIEVVQVPLGQVAQGRLFDIGGRGD